MGKHNCGQCEYYLHKSEKCPHRERTAYSEECEMFSYTNPIRRIDSLQERIKELEAEIKAYKNCSKDHKEKCPDVKCWVQVLRDEQMDEIEQLKELEKIPTSLWTFTPATP